MQLNTAQFEKLAGYFVDLAKVWFASGVIGFFFNTSFFTNTVGASYINLAGGAFASAVFLAIAVRMLK